MREVQEGDFTALATAIADADKECCPDCKDHANAALAAFRGKLASARSTRSTHSPSQRPRHAEFFKCSGRAGETVGVEHPAALAFRGEKIIATDNHEGKGTRCRLFFAGWQQENFSPTTDHAANNLSCGINIGLAEAGDAIRFEVEFLKDGDFSAVIVGTPRRAA